MTIHSNAENKIKASFTPDEVAEYLTISKSGVYRLVYKGDLPFKKVGKLLRFKRDDIEEYFQTDRI